jgi:glycosyltransferase involved in cell wall biosynthesis
MLASLGLLPESLPVTCVAAPGIDLGYVSQLPLPALDRGALFLMAADLYRREGVLEYCEAAEQLRTRARHVRCLLTGKPVTGAGAFPLDELRRYRSAVQYLGPRDDVVQLVKRCHALVMPAHAPGDGASALLAAALAIGRPVIAADSSLTREAVEHGVNGYLVPPQDAAQLARAMAQLLMRPDLIPRMASASREIAEHNFDIRAVTGAVLAALRL